MFQVGQRVIEKSSFRYNETLSQARYGTIIVVIENDDDWPALLVLHDEPMRSIWRASRAYADYYTLWYDQPQPIKERDHGDE